MDKFGIFNLLGSLLGKNPSSNQQNVDNSSSQKNDFLSSISSLFSNSSKNNKQFSAHNREKERRKNNLFYSPAIAIKNALYNDLSRRIYQTRQKQSE